MTVRTVAMLTAGGLAPCLSSAVGGLIERYSDAQTKDLEETINASDVDLVIIGTPIDLSRVMKITKTRFP